MDDYNSDPDDPTEVMDTSNPLYDREPHPLYDREPREPSPEREPITVERRYPERPSERLNL